MNVVPASVRGFDHTCVHCGALLLKSEIGSAKICCHNGKVKVPLYDIMSHRQNVLRRETVRARTAPRKPEEEELTRRLALTPHAS